MFGELQPRFSRFGIPPDSNANFAFILTAIDLIDEKAALLLPNCVLCPSTKQEKKIIKELVESNLIEAIILMPDKMFESTAIAVCVLLISKQKKTLHIEMIDMRQEFTEVQRDQKGQYGGASHINRVYHKMVKTITDEAMAKAIKAIEEHSNVNGYCKSVSIEEIKEVDYNLAPTKYIGFQEQNERHRPYDEIVADYNRIVAQKNAIKLTVNEKLAKSLGIYDMFLAVKSQPEITDIFAVVGKTAEKESFLSLSKNAAEFRVENKSKEQFPEIFSLFLMMWKQRIMSLNNEENRILAEFRDAFMADAMSGKLSSNLDNL